MSATGWHVHNMRHAFRDDECNHGGQPSRAVIVVDVAARDAIEEALADQMHLGTSGRWIVDLGTTPEHLAADVWSALVGERLGDAE